MLYGPAGKIAGVILLASDEVHGARLADVSAVAGLIAAAAEKVDRIAGWDRHVAILAVLAFAAKLAKRFG